MIEPTIRYSKLSNTKKHSYKAMERIILKEYVKR